VIVLGFEKLGWDLTIVGGQPKTPIVASIVYGPAHVTNYVGSTFTFG
jgi:hypothetical protein